jgi:cytidylate kinase
LIAIDGPSGVGKSTVSRAVAERLGAAYLDTGATYRAATLAVVRSGVSISSETSILEELMSHSIDYTEQGIMLDGFAVATDVRSDDVTGAVSAVSAHAEVRREIVELQRRWVADHDGDAVVEGRDIGTVVFPDAPVKIYLTANPLVRAMRRSGDTEASGKPVERIAEEIAARDHADSTRETSPLRPAQDALIIDTSDLAIDEVVEQIVAQTMRVSSNDS